MVLLVAHRAADSLIDSPDATEMLGGELVEPDQPASVIGPYKLLQPIGGGHGDGVHGRAASAGQGARSRSASIKAGMDSREVVARFEAERQALALMDHPNIAKVFDAGATDSGRPYFVMELVKGVPITQYCDERQI